MKHLLRKIENQHLGTTTTTATNNIINQKKTEETASKFTNLSITTATTRSETGKTQTKRKVQTSLFPNYIQ